MKVKVPAFYVCVSPFGARADEVEVAVGRPGAGVVKDRQRGLCEYFEFTSDLEARQAAARVNAAALGVFADVRATS